LIIISFWWPSTTSKLHVTTLTYLLLSLRGLNFGDSAGCEKWRHLCREYDIIMGVKWRGQQLLCWNLIWQLSVPFCGGSCTSQLRTTSTLGLSYSLETPPPRTLLISMLVLFL
jgi:hypothetical protein